VTDPSRPLPRPSPLTQPFWDGAGRHELWVQRCGECGTYLFYPRRLCTACGSAELEWEQVSGRGTVFTYTVAHRPTHPAFADRVPYVIAVVELEEGPKLTTNIVNADLADVRIGLPVEATYEDLGDVSLVCFQPR
jgi:uncharacterized OB-fold protein